MSGVRVADRDPAGGRTPGALLEPTVGAPWFVQFWPVFIAVLMGLSIAASLVTVVIAHRHADVDVRLAERSDGAPAPIHPTSRPAGMVEPSR